VKGHFEVVDLLIEIFFKFEVIDDFRDQILVSGGEYKKLGTFLEKAFKRIIFVVIELDRNIKCFVL